MVSMVSFDFGVTFNLLGEERADGAVRLECGFAFGQFGTADQTFRVELAAQIVQLIGHRLERAFISNDGSLTLRFERGFIVRAESSERAESWNVSSTHPVPFQLVSTPGGKLEYFPE
jgi:hypothetical protein